jgi:hypothetical protein
MVNKNVSVSLVIPTQLLPHYSQRHLIINKGLQIKALKSTGQLTSPKYIFINLTFLRQILH